MRDDRLKAIPNKVLDSFPFNYKDLSDLTSVEQSTDIIQYKRTGKMDILQNENARFQPFYKMISKL